jgi:hemerythrin-like metal-binding protein
MPAYIKWQNNYNLGHEKIDGQHKTIIAIINNVFSLVKDNSLKDDIWNALNDLKKYTIDHFNFEEEILMRIEYPEIKTHKLLHQKMRSQTEDLAIKRPNISTSVLAEETLALLKEWWLNHIRGVDTQYVPYLGKLDS